MSNAAFGWLGSGNLVNAEEKKRVQFARCVIHAKTDWGADGLNCRAQAILTKKCKDVLSVVFLRDLDTFVELT